MNMPGTLKRRREFAISENGVVEISSNTAITHKYVLSNMAKKETNVLSYIILAALAKRQKGKAIRNLFRSIE
jgi:hypothetical protein